MNGYIVIDDRGKVVARAGDSDESVLLGYITHDDAQVRVAHWVIGQRTAWYWTVRDVAEIAARTWGPEGVTKWYSTDLYTPTFDALTTDTADGAKSGTAGSASGTSG